MSLPCVEVFFSHIAKKLRQGTRLCFRNFRVSKNFMPERGKSWFSIEFFCLTVPKNFVGEPFFSQNFWCRKILCLSCGVGGGEYHDFLSIFLSHSAENIRRGTLQCVTNFGYRKILRLKELCHDFVSTFCCLTVPKIFVEEPFWYVFQKHFQVANKNYGWEGGGHQGFVDFFCLTGPKRKVLEKNSSVFQKIFVIEKFMGKTGHITIFGRYSYVSLCQKIAKGSPTVSLENFWVRKGLWLKGGCHVLPSKTFCLTLPKIFVEEPNSVSLISDIKNVEDKILKFLAGETLEPQTYCLRI